MKRVKAIFVTIYSVLMNIALIYGLVQIFNGHPLAIWLSVVFTTLPAVIFFGSIFIIDVPRTGKTLFVAWIPLLLGFASLLFFSTSFGINSMALGIATFSLLGWGAYIFWYSNYGGKRNGEILAVGKRIPVFPLENIEGEQVSSDSFLGKPSIFLFYRGNWCPFCMAQIKEMAGQYQQIEAAGAQVVLISPQSNKHNQSLAKKLNIPAHLMSDKGLKASKQLGLLHEGGTPLGMGAMGYESDTTMPTLVVTDAQGMIRFADLTDNYRLRPEPATYLQLLTEKVQS